MINNFLVPVRDFLRKGEPLPTPDPTLQKCTLMPVPLFHVTGSHAIMMPATLMGNKIVLMYKVCILFFSPATWSFTAEKELQRQIPRQIVGCRRSFEID